MIKTKRRFFYIVLCLLTLFLVACGGEEGPVDPVVKPEDEISFTIEETSIALELGETKKLTITKKGNKDFNLVFSSSNSEVVKVEEGKLTAVSVGEATITIAIENKENTKKEIKVKVNEPTLTLTGKSKMLSNESQQLTYTLTSKLVETITWTSSNTEIATVDDKGNVVAIKGGKVTITAEAMTSKVKGTITIEIEQVIVNPESIKIETNSEKVYLDTPLKLKATVLPTGANQEVIWSTTNTSRATIDEEGNVTILKSGKIVIKCVSKENENIKASITIEVLDYIDPEAFFNSIHVERPLNNLVKAIGWGPIKAADGLTQVHYNTILAGAVSLITWNKPLYVNENFIVPKGNNTRPGTIREVKYITVHDTATTHSHTTAYNLANNLKYSTNTTSWHYSCGDGIVFQSIPDNEVAHHAGDGTKVPLEFTDTGIKATGPNAAKVTISKDGYWELNGIKSNIQAPLAGSRIANNSDLPYTGINNYVGENGNYWISNTWWSSTYQTVSNRGGNLNSIGIESCVNYGCDLYRVWMTLAQLIGTRLLPQNHIKPTDVKQHNTFSGKDCPETMRHADLWDYFIKMVEAEYTLYIKLSDFDITFTSNNPELICETGQIINFPEVDTEVTYTIHVQKKDGSYDKTLTYKSIVPAKVTNARLIGNEDLYYYMTPTARAKQLEEN